MENLVEWVGSGRSGEMDGRLAGYGRGGVVVNGAFGVISRSGRGTPKANIRIQIFKREKTYVRVRCSGRCTREEN